MDGAIRHIVDIPFNLAMPLKDATFSGKRASNLMNPLINLETPPCDP